jgi:hypothetical protein
MEFSKPLQRRWRRWQTHRHGSRAQRIHLAMLHPNGALGCACERSPHYFHKRGAISCRCTRPKGRPKLGTLHDLGNKWRATTEARIAANRLVRAWVAALRSLHPLDVEL